MFKNKHRIAFWVIILVIIALIVACIINLNKYSKENSVIYLSTGEVYVGKLLVFPQMVLSDGYIFQVTQDPLDKTKTNFQLNPLKEALWAPQKLIVNRDQVLFYGPLDTGSKIAETLAQQK